MSVTIVQKNKSIEDFNPNIAGWQLCGFINAISGALVHLENGEADCPRPPNSLTSAQAKNTADTIEFKMLNSAMAKTRMDLLEKRSTRLLDGDLRLFIENYVDWLRNCKGYKIVY